MNPHLQSALRFLLLLSPSLALAAPSSVFNIGTIDNGGGEFDHENYADALFYWEAGDYSHLQAFGDTRALTLHGGIATGPEVLQDNGNDPSPGDHSIGFRRAFTNNTPANNIFFQLTPEEQRGNLQFYIKTGNASGSNSANDVSFYLNGNEFGRQVFPSHANGSIYRFDLNASEYGALVGSNVLSMVTNANAEWQIVDWTHLQAVSQFNVFNIGINNNTNTEFEAEGAPNVNSQFYYHAGNYSTLMGVTGAGQNVANPEPIRDDSNQEGMPRALTPSNSAVDIFFKLSEEEVQRGHAEFEMDLIQLGAGSSHDLEVLFNGNVVGSKSSIVSDTLFSTSFDLADYGTTAGEQVLSIRRTGGSGASPWIQFDYLSLNVVPEPSRALLLTALLGASAFRRQRTQGSHT